MGVCNTLKRFPNSRQEYACDPHLDQTKLNDLLLLKIDGVLIMAGRATLSMRLKNLCLTKSTLPTLGREVGNGSPNIFFRVVHLRHKQLTHYQSRDNVKVDLGRAEPVLAVTSTNNIDLSVHHLEGKSDGTFIQMMF